MGGGGGGGGVQKSQKCDDVIYEWSLRVHCFDSAPGLQIQNYGSPITKVKLKLTLT